MVCEIRTSARIKLSPSVSQLHPFMKSFCQIFYKSPRTMLEPPTGEQLEPFVGEFGIDIGRQIGESDGGIRVLEHLLHVPVEFEIATHQAVDDP